MRRTSEDIMREALREQLEQEISKVPSDEQIRGMHTFSRRFRRRMKPLLENPDSAGAGDHRGGAEAETGVRSPGESRRNVRILAACIACFLVLGAALGVRNGWFSLSPESGLSGAADTAASSESVREEAEEPDNADADSGGQGGTGQGSGEQAENDLENVTMTVTAAGNSSAEILVENGSDEYIWYGDAYSLEKLDEETDTWLPVQESGETAYNDLAYHVYAGGSSRWTADWTERYGVLAPGTYRIVKVLYVGRDGGGENARTMTAEFTVGNP